MNKALFLDLDHTLIRPKSGETFPQNADDWEWMPGMLTALQAEVRAAGEHPGAHIILVTNQGGVAAGHHTEREIEQKLQRICRELREAVGCPVHFQACYYLHGYDRKPAPGMAYRAAMQFHLDLSACTMIGDMDSDRLFAIAAGIGRYVDVKAYLPAPALPPPVPYPGDCAGRDHAQCLRTHCDCWFEAGCPARKDYHKGLAPVAYQQPAPTFMRPKLDHNPQG